jgi:hypothetical protein
MTLGPVEILCIKFPNTYIKDDIAAALKTLVEIGTIRIIDILFIRKSENGEVTVNEIDEMKDVDHSLLDPLVSDISGLISEVDIQGIAEALDNSSFAALMLFENTWATAFRDAVINANGQLLLNERIPSSVIDEALAVQAQVAV